MSESETPEKKWRCDRCGQKEGPNETLILVKIPVSGEEWDLCDPCVDEMVEWIENTTIQR